MGSWFSWAFGLGGVGSDGVLTTTLAASSEPQRSSGPAGIIKLRVNRWMFFNRIIRDSYWWVRLQLLQHTHCHGNAAEVRPPHDADWCSDFCCCRFKHIYDHHVLSLLQQEDLAGETRQETWDTRYKKRDMRDEIQDKRHKGEIGNERWETRDTGRETWDKI